MIVVIAVNAVLAAIVFTGLIVMIMRAIRTQDSPPAGSLPGPEGRPRPRSVAPLGLARPRAYAARRHRRTEGL